MGGIGCRIRSDIFRLQRCCFLQHEDGIVILDPVADRDGPVFCLRGPDHDLLDAGVDDLPFAHRAAHRVAEQLVGAGIPADQIDRRADHVPPRGRDDGVRLGMDAAAQLVALAGGDVQGFAGADPQVAAVAASARRAVVAGRDDFVVAHDNGAVFPPKTGRALQNRVGDVEVIVLLAGPVIHAFLAPFCLCGLPLFAEGSFFLRCLCIINSRNPAVKPFGPAGPRKDIEFLPIL